MNAPAGLADDRFAAVVGAYRGGRPDISAAAETQLARWAAAGELNAVRQGLLKLCGPHQPAPADLAALRITDVFCVAVVELEAESWQHTEPFDLLGELHLHLTGQTLSLAPTALAALLRRAANVMRAELCASGGSYLYDDDDCLALARQGVLTGYAELLAGQAAAAPEEMLNGCFRAPSQTWNTLTARLSAFAEPRAGHDALQHLTARDWVCIFTQVLLGADMSIHGRCDPQQPLSPTVLQKRLSRALVRHCSALS